MDNSPKIRLLIAEDDFLVAEEIKRLLRGGRYEVVGEAANGREACALTADLKPDVILMDIRMPEMDGLSASRKISEECPTPIVIMTAYEAVDLVEEAGRAGVSAFLTKPPDLAAIDRAVTIALVRHADLIELRRLNRELAQALEEVKTLRGILPMCSFCKKIRTEDGVWQDVAVYIQRQTEADISHGLCPDCMKEHYPEVLAVMRARGKSGLE